MTETANTVQVEFILHFIHEFTMLIEVINPYYKGTQS